MSAADRTPEGASRVLPAVFAALHALLATLALASAAYLWRLRCEGFGCTGIGVAWFAWTPLFLVALALGLVASRMASPGSFARRAVRAILGVQLAVGVLLGLAWVVHRSA